MDKSLVEDFSWWWERERANSTGLILIPCPIRENPPILSQFERKLQNLISDDSL